MTITLELPNLRGNATLLKRYPTILKKHLRNASGRLGTQGKKIARQEVPVDTGRLQSEITKDPATHRSVSIRSDTYYAEYVEYGTVNTPANPYMGRTMKRMKPIVKQEVIVAVEAANAEVAKKWKGRRTLTGRTLAKKRQRVSTSVIQGTVTARTPGKRKGQRKIGGNM